MPESRFKIRFTDKGWSNKSGTGAFEEPKSILQPEQDAVTADFQMRTDLTQAQKDSAYQTQRGLIDSTGKTVGYTPSVQQQEINQFVGGDEPKGFSPRGKASEEFLKLILQGGKQAADAVIGGLQTIQKGREGIRKGFREVAGQDKVKDEFIISDKQGEITSTTDPKIAQSYREQGFKVASRFGDRSQISTGLKDVASGLGKQAAGALQAGLSSLPAVAALNVASPAITKLGGDIAEKAGYKREKGEEITQKIAPFVFGLPVGLGSLASEEITKILDNAGAFDVFSLEDKNTAKDLIQNGLFFGIAGLGGKGYKAGKEKVKKIIEGKVEIPEFMPKALGEQGLFEKELPKQKIIPEAEKQTADLPTLEEQRAIQERQTKEEIPRPIKAEENIPAGGERIRQGEQGEGLTGIRPEAEIQGGEKEINANKNAAFALFEKGKKPSEIIKALNITRQEAVSYKKEFDEQGISPRYKLEETVKPEVPKVVEPQIIEPPAKFTVQKKAELPKIEQKPVEIQKPIAEDIKKIPETIVEPVKAEIPKPKISFAPPKDANVVIVNFIDGKQSKLPVKDLDVLGSDPSKFKNISFGKVDLNKMGGLKWDTFKEIKKIDPKDPAFAGVEEQIPVSLETKRKPVKASEIIAQVERGLGVPIRIGKVTKPTARAFYKVKPEVIRMREANDLDSMSHEIAHHIDKKILGGFREGENKGRFDKWRDELQNLDYDQTKKRTYEGFAEFMRHYLTRDDAVMKAPEFYKYFENEFLPKNPEISKVIKTAKESVTSWREQGSLSRVISQIDFAGKKSAIPFKEKFERAKIKTQQLTIDRLAPLKYVVGQILKEGGKELRPSEDPYQIAASVAKTAAAKARQFVIDGSFDFQLNKKGKGLKEIVTPVAQEIEPAIAYAYAKHAKSLHGRGINPGIELRDAEYVLANYKKREYENFSKEFTEYSNSLIDYLVDAGGLSKEAAGRMRELNPFYIPLKRSFVDKIISTPKGKGVVDLPSPIKKIKGSGREIINPLESIIAQTEQIITVADKARVARALADLSDKFEGIGKWIEKVPAPIETKITELENLKKQIEDAGGDLSNADMESIITLFSQGKNYFGKDNIVSIYRKGKREFFELDPILYDAMKGLDKVTLPIMLDYVLGKPTRAIRLGATGIRAGFSLITNPIRDAQTFALQSEKVGVRPDKVAKAIFEELQGKSEFAKEFRRSGGEMAQPLGLDRKTLQNVVQEILASDKKSKALNIVKHPIEATRKILSFPEAGTRLAEFEAVMNKYKPKFEEAKARGDLNELKKLQEDAAIEASNAANEVTVNFKRAGAYAEILNQIIPFFNPAVQGISRMGRTIYAHPVRSGLRATALLTAPTLALWWVNKDEDWYKNLPDWQKYGFWNFKIGDEIIRLPKPFEWGYLFGAVPEGMANSLYQKNPQYYKDAIGSTVDAMMPDITPGAIKPAIETYFNWDIFKERPVVSKSQEGLLPEQQFSPYTSGLSKEVGKLLNFSPAKLDHLLSGYTGGLATDILNGLPREYKEMADVPIIGRLFTRISATGFGGENVQRFYDILKEAESIVRTKKIKEDGGDVFEPTDLQKKQIENIKKIRKTAKDLKWLRGRQQDINKLDVDADIKSKLNKEIEYAAAKRAEIMLKELEGKNEEDSINLLELKTKLQQYAPERKSSEKERKFRINYK